MKSITRSIIGSILLILGAPGLTGQNQDIEFPLDADAISFVIIEVGGVVGESVISRDQYVDDLVVHLKSINAELATEKKFAALALDSSEGGSKYLTIRPFNDFGSAEGYARTIEMRIDSGTFSRAGRPFPISQENYKTCGIAKDFARYSEYYYEQRN
jgi:hypothetical protein